MIVGPLNWNEYFSHHKGSKYEVKGIGGGSQAKMRFRVILKVPDTIFQELFTESKKLAPLPYSDASKLTPTHTFSGKCMEKSRKMSKNSDFFCPKNAFILAPDHF